MYSINFPIIYKQGASIQIMKNIMIKRERPGLMASRFMAEWRNMTGEDSATQDMLLAMWAHPSPTNINEYNYIQDLNLRPWANQDLQSKLRNLDSAF